MKVSNRLKRVTVGRPSEHHSRINRSVVAGQVGVTPGYISRILKGNRNPSLKTAAKISAALGITLEELLKLIGNGVGKSSSKG